ncbi:MAG: hypothetical protein C4581_03235 [Nitrospiraceae bacterium]|nr:MAG: hypothetical protein C4581_03235 [Nitrospiraceae bacterium]
MSLSCLLSGILIDIDHVYDYVKEFGFPFKVKDFVNTVYHNGISRLTFVFHSWEILLLLGIVASFTNWNAWIAGVIIGFGHHIVLDKLNNEERLRTYSFIWRWGKQFEFETTFPNDAKRKMNSRAR